MSRIDSYLDDLFNGLAGTGEVGRRLLRESEDHLRAAASEAVARGNTREEAENHAVESFGPVEALVREFHQPVNIPKAVMQAVSAGWFSIAALAIVAGVSFLAFFAGTRGVLFAHHSSHVRCAPDSAAMVPMSNCAHHGIASLMLGLVLVLSGSCVIAIRVAAVRRHWLPQAAARLIIFGITSCLLAALAVAMDSSNPIFGSPAIWESIHLLIAAALVALGLAMMAGRARNVFRYR